MADAEQATPPQKKWYQKTGGVILFLVIFFPVGLYLMWKHANWSKTVKWVITVIIALIVIGNGSNANKTSTPSSVSNQVSSGDQTKTGTATIENSPVPTEIPIPTDTPMPSLTPKQMFSEFQKSAKSVTIAQLYKTPNSYQGEDLLFTCDVSSFPKDENGDVAAINCFDQSGSGANVQIGIGTDVDVTQINENDTLRVYGVGSGAIKGTNAYGGAITTAGALGMYLDDLTTGYSNYPK